MTLIITSQSETSTLHASIARASSRWNMWAAALYIGSGPSSSSAAHVLSARRSESERIAAPALLARSTAYV